MLKMLANLIFPSAKEANKVYEQVLAQQQSVVASLSSNNNNGGKKAVIKELAEKMLNEVVKDA